MLRQHFGQLSLPRSAAFLLTAVLPVCGPASAASGPRAASVQSDKPKSALSERTLPLVFEENKGQLPSGSAFAGRTHEYTVELRPSELRFGLYGKHGDRTVSLSFVGSQGAKPEGVSDAGFRTNFYLGKDPGKWHTGVRNYDRVALRGLYPGMDAEFYSRGNEIEHDFILAAGADPSRLAMHLAGAKTTTLSASGDVLLTGEDGALRLHRPVAYQVLADGTRQSVDAQFALAREGDTADLRFTLGAYDHTRALVIDPVISYATYVAGGAGSTPTAVTSDTAGNVYLTGTSLSDPTTYGVTSPMAVPPLSNSSAPGHTVSFVARFTAADQGSKIAWLTYYGSTTKDVTSNAIALQTAGTLVYIGGQTAATDLPGTTGGKQANGGGGSGTVYGFVADLLASTGAAGGSTTFATYVDGNVGGSGSTGVAALAATGTSVVAAGYSTGASYPTTTTLSAPVTMLPTGFCSSGGAGGNNAKGLLVNFSSDLTSTSYSTYVCGDMPAPLYLTGVRVSSATGPYYIAGYTTGDFPKGAPVPYTGAAGTMFTPPLVGGTAKTVPDAFAASLTDNPSTTILLVTTPETGTVNYSFWSNGDGDDEATGLALDSAGGLVVVGTTTSSNLTTSATSSPGLPGTPTSFQTSSAATLSGFAAHVSSGGQVSAVTYVAGTSGTTSTVASVALDSGNNVYLTGKTNDTEANFPQAGSAALTGVPSLPAPEDRSLNSTSAPPVQRGYLLQLPSALSSVTYRAYFGPDAGASAGVSVALDTPASGTPNAYVLLNEQPASGAYSFTTASAAQLGPQTGVAQAAYLAQVAFDAGTPGLTKGSLAYTPDYVGYNNTDYTPAVYSTLDATWHLTGTSASRVVFNLPQNQYLKPFQLSYLTVTISSTSTPAPAYSCKLGPTPSIGGPTGSLPGITCIVTGLSSTDDVAFELKDDVIGVPASGTSFPLVADAFDSQGAYVPLTQTIKFLGVPKFTLSASGTPTSIYAAPPDATSYSTNMQVTYTFTVTNTTANDSPSTVLTTNLPSKFTQVGTATLTVSGGAPLNCSPAADLNTPQSTITCDVPGTATMTYKVTGVYKADTFDATSPTQTVTFTPKVNFTKPTVNAPDVMAAPAITTTVLGYSKIKVVLGHSSPTYNGGYRLGDPSVNLTAAVTNEGPNFANSFTVTMQLPTGFAYASYSSNSTAGATATCTASAPNVTCTIKNLPGNNGLVTLTFAGSFTDKGDGTDAVPVPDATSPNTPEKRAQTAGKDAANVSTSVQPVVFDPATGSGTLDTAASPNDTFPVARVNSLTYTLAVAAPLPGDTVNELNPSHTSDSITYTATVSNTGTSVVRGLAFEIPVPSSTSLTVTPNPLVASYSGVTSIANQLTCASYTPGDASIVCYTNDLVTPSSTATTAPANLIYTVTFTAQFNETAVPQDMKPGTTTFQQVRGVFYAAAKPVSPVSDTYTSPHFGMLSGSGPAGPFGPDPFNLTVQRSTAVKTVVKSGNLFGRLGAAPATFKDAAHINLDEHTSGNAPGANDTLQFAVQAYNTGPNDAAGVALNIPLPPFMLVAIPVNCTMNTTAGMDGSTTLYPTGASGATMTCVPPSSSTPATANQPGGTKTGQLSTPGTCPAIAPPAYPASAVLATSTYTGGCFTVYFDAKFADPPAATGSVVGSSPTGTANFTTAQIVANDVDTAFAPNLPTPASVVVQRAAHVHLTSSTAAPTYSDGTTLAGAVVGEAQPMVSDLNTQALLSGSKVYNCFRYALNVVNDGPNYALTPQLKYDFNTLSSAGGYVPLQTMVGAGTAPTLSPVNCFGATNNKTPLAGQTAKQGVALGVLGYNSSTGSAVVVTLDGYFDLGTTPDTIGSTFKTDGLDFTDYSDSPKTGTADPQVTQAMTVVNTPINPAGPVYKIVPPGIASTSPQVSLAFSAVTAPGITAAAVANTSALALPSGKSPYPPDAGTVRSLYQPGTKTPNFYSVSTTATVTTPSTGTQSLTSVCATKSGGLPDLFVKPERALMWVLQNGTPNTTYGNKDVPVPNISSTGVLAGDVTVYSKPTGGAAFVAQPTVTFPQTPQAQPEQVCGDVNGFFAGAAMTFAVLEPVNFPPYVVAGATPPPAQSKGSTSSQSTVYLQYGKPTTVAGATTYYTYDFNDQDPCYIADGSGNGTKRTSCNDNPYLYAYVFYGGSVQPQSPPPANPRPISALTPDPTVAVNGYDLFSANLTNSSEVFVAVADQAVGADAQNQALKTSNPGFTNQGNALVGPQTLCDPGNSLGGATYAPAAACPNANLRQGTTTTAFSSSTAERFVIGGAGYSAGNVGAAGVVASGNGISGGGYIPLPYPDTVNGPQPSSTSPGNAPFNPGAKTATSLGDDGGGKTTAAIATVTAGQTAAFTWPWLGSQTLANGVANGAQEGDLYNLACTAADGTSTPPLQCSVTTLTPSDATVPANQYRFGHVDPGTGATSGYSNDPTIFVYTSGSLYAGGKDHTAPWKSGGLFLALLVPVLVFRKRIGRGAVAAVLLLSLAATPLLSGCGSSNNNGGGGGGTGTTPATPAGSYLFRVTATHSGTAKGTTTVTSAVFEVIVK